MATRPAVAPLSVSDFTNAFPNSRKVFVDGPHGIRVPMREITLSGEISSCEKLFIEGVVEANLTNCRDLDIAESGLFKGSTSIEGAEVRGRFEGNLTVRKRLLIKATGRVSGTIRYGQIEIERGGQISGDIQALPAGESGEVSVEGW